MRIAWLTAGHELRRTLRRRSFWLTTFLLPAIVLVMVFIPQLLQGGQEMGAGLGRPTAETGAIGYVDEAGVAGGIPKTLPAGTVHQYGTEREAQEALGSGEVERYYVIPADYVGSGELTVVERSYQPLRAIDDTALIRYVINAGITGDERVAALLHDPTPVVESSAVQASGANTAAGRNARSLLPYLLMFVLYLALALTSGFMLQSVSREKENRTAEILLVSVKPRDLMLGKIAGLSAVGLLQVTIWLAVVFGALATQGTLAGVHLEITSEYAVQVVPWALAYFFLGYLMYASAYAVLGVLARTTRDANHFVYLAILPLVVPLLLNGVLSSDPNGTAATIMSLFPLTSPIAMVARQGAAFVPWWQSLAGLMALGIFAYLFVIVAARRFRAENLLSTRELSWGRLRTELLPSFAGSFTSHSGGTAASGEPAREKTRKRAAKLSPARFYGLMAAAAAILVYGVVKRAGGDGSGLVFAGWGVVLAVIALYRYRKG